MKLTSVEKALLHNLRALHTKLRDETYEKFHRINPFYEDLFEWAERGQYWTGGQSRNVTIYNSTTVVGNVEKLESEHELCVFVADDSMVARRKIVEVLDKMGVKHIQANNGREAWERLRSMADAAQNSGINLHDQIQVILTDAEMPEMDGYVLTQHIKSDRRFEGIPVVMHSSLSSEANRALGRRVGVDQYVPKFDSMVLSSTLRPLLV